MKILLSLTFSFFSLFLVAQQYLADPINGYSRKKTAYITMNDGTEIEGTIHNTKTKKGLYEEITMKIDGKKEKISVADIKSMYIPQSGVDKFATAMDKAHDLSTYENMDSELNGEHLKEGYAYFVSTQCQIRKKKEGIVLLQLLNPTFSKKIKIFFDPHAAESASVGFGGMTLAGGNAKSYFIQKGDNEAYRIKKKDYKDEFDKLFTKCGAFKKSVDKVSWSDFAEHVYNYSKMCEE